MNCTISHLLSASMISFLLVPPSHDACAFDTRKSSDPLKGSVLNLRDFGKGGLGGDDTSVFRLALAEASRQQRAIQVPASRTPYRVSPLYLRSNTTMLLDSGVTIQALPGFADGQKLLNIDDANAVQVIGYGASLAMNRAEYKSGEYRHCLSITGSNLVVIKGISCVNSGGNGVYVGGSDRKKFSEDVILEDLNTTNSLSAGLKIASARNVTIRRSRFEGSHGFEPSGSKKAADRASGIELYPGGASRLENIRLEDTVTAHNAGDGIRIVLSRLLHTGPAVSVTILRHRDTAAGGSSFLGIDDPPSRQAVSGQIMFEDCSSEAAQEYGAVFSFWNSSGPRVSFIRLTVIDPNSAGTTMNNAAVAVKRGGGGHEPIGNVEFAYTTICDTRRHPKLDYYFTIADYSHIGIHNVIFRDAVKLTGARHKEPLGLYQGEGIAGIQRADDPAVRALWQNLEKHDSAKHERGQ